MRGLRDAWLAIGCAIGAAASPLASDHPLTRASEPAPADVVTPLDYFESGRQAVEAYLDPDLASTIEKAKQFCARVEIRFGHRDDSYRSVMGSGVLVGRGRWVLTAGHSLEGIRKGQVSVTRADGGRFAARVVEHHYRADGGPDDDWALLELVGSPSLDQPVVIAAARPGERAFVLGYPDQIGIDAEGQVNYGSSGSADYLEPLVTVGRVEEPDAVTLAPLAGSIPTSGMSGGPVFDADGRLIGIFVSILRSDSERGSRWTYRMVPAEVLGDRTRRGGTRSRAGPARGPWWAASGQPLSAAARRDIRHPGR